MANTSLMLVDDHPLFRQGLRRVLEAQEDLEVIMEVADGEEALRLVKQLTPDVVIMDITMPGLNGIEATRQIVSELPDIKVIALSMHSDRKFVREMLSAGASGYLLKDSAFEELSNALHAVYNNQLYLSAKIDDLGHIDYAGKVKAETPAKTHPLSNREREVLQLLAEGKTTQQIASSLCVSGKTIASHRTQIMNKLGLTSVAELTKYAVREGLTSIDA